MPSFDGSDYLVGIGGPCERFGVFVGLGDEAVDGGLEVDEGVKDAALEASFGELGEVTLDGVEPGAGGRCEVEGEALVTVEPGPDLWVLMSGVIVEDDMDGLVGGGLGVDQIQEADEFLMAMSLHVAADHRAVEHIEGGEQGGRAVALVIMGHGAEPPLLHRQARLSSVERLDLALFVEGQDDGVAGWVDVEANDIAQLGDEVRIIRELELAVSVRGQAMGSPDLAHRALADTGGLGHHRRRPMGCLERRVTLGQRHHALGYLGTQGRDPRRPRLVAQKPVDAVGHEPLLPAPDAGLRLAGPAHDRVRAEPIGAEKDDGCPPHVFLGGVAVADNAFKTKPVGRIKCDRDSCTHLKDSQMREVWGIPNRTRTLSGNH